MNIIQLTLQKKLNELRSKNPRLSERYFAQKLGISSGALSEILRGKRKISLKLAQRMASGLQLSPSEREVFLSRHSAEPRTSNAEYVQLADDQFHLIADWIHFAILNLVKSRHCHHRAAWFAKRLLVPVPQVKLALSRLKRLKLLQFDGVRYTRLQTNLNTSDDILNLSIQKSHLQELQRLSELLPGMDVGERDFTSMTLLLKPEQMPDFKKALRQFQDRFACKFETTDSETAYRLTLALFPLRERQKKSN